MVRPVDGPKRPQHSSGTRKVPEKLAAMSREVSAVAFPAIQRAQRTPSRPTMYKKGPKRDEVSEVAHRYLVTKRGK